MSYTGTTTLTFTATTDQPLDDGGLWVEIFEKDPARVFPITIDPTYASANVTTSFDTYVSSLYPTATYSTSTKLWVGTYGSGDKYRSFLSFPLASFGGKDIVSASLSLYEFYSWSCTAKPFYSYGTVGQPSATTSWSNMPGQDTNFGTTTVASGDVGLITRTHHRQTTRVHVALAAADAAGGSRATSG